MNHLVLNRIVTSLNETIGVLYVNGLLICNSLEPHIVNCIPSGTYGLQLVLSPTFGYDVLYIAAPKPYNHCEFHRGNTFKDTSGCILPGLIFPQTPKSLHYSTEYLDLLVAMFSRRAFSSLHIL